MSFIFGLLLVGAILSSWIMTRQVRAFIYNPVESLAEYLVSYVKSDTMGKKDSSWDRDGPRSKLRDGDYYVFSDSPPSTDGSFSFYHNWFQTTDFFEKAKIDIQKVKAKQKDYITELLYISIFYLVLGIVSLIVIIHFLLSWFVIPDWETGETLIYSSDMVFRGTPFGIAEYLLGTKFNELPKSEIVTNIRLFANFFTSLIIITGFLQISVLLFQRRKLESHFHGHAGEINFIALFLVFAHKTEKIALAYNHPTNLIGENNGAIIFEEKLRDWHRYKKDIVEGTLEKHFNNG